MRYIRVVPSSHLSVQSAAGRTAALINVLCGENPAPAPAPAPTPAAVAVAEVLRAHGETGPFDLAPGDISDLRTAAAQLREVFAAESVDVAASRLNSLLGRTSGTVRLTSHDGSTPWHPHLDSDDEAPWGEWFLASSCLALAVLIWDHQRPPGGVCAAAGCRNVHLTQGSGPPRRYCSRRCATRERVAAHRRAHAPSRAETGAGAGAGARAGGGAGARARAGGGAGAGPGAGKTG